MLSSLGTRIIEFLQQLLIAIPGLYLGVVFHEVAHGYIAYKMGDPTARNFGRLTLNPIVHIDIFGSILLPLVLILFNTGFIFGYAKPVPINPSYFRNYRKGIRYSSLAGPVTNFILAFILGCMLGLYVFLLKISGHPINEVMSTPGFANRALEIIFSVIQFAIIINIVLGIFNFLPIPPLDGANIVATFLPGNAMYRYLSIGRFGFILIFALFYFARGLLYPAINKLYQLFTWPLNFL